MKILTTPRMERCIGCHSCSLACARLVHKRLSWDTAGIRIASSGGLSTGFNPGAVTIPARFSEITTWEGRLDAEYLAALKVAYARRILEMDSPVSSALAPS